MNTDIKLNYENIIHTIDLLEKRVGDRFPEAGLRKVCLDFYKTSKGSKNKIEWIAKPNYLLRIGSFFLILLGLMGIIYSFTQIDLAVKKITFSDIITVTEAGLNDILLIGAAIFFLVTMEIRIKRARALKMLNELRVFTHIVDMHQLTKDPILINNSKNNTENSPKRSFTRFELERYLNYCSELLSLIGKVAALYSQSLPDDIVVKTVNDIETLTAGIGSKIWQKLSILNDYDIEHSKEGENK